MDRGPTDRRPGSCHAAGVALDTTGRGRDPSRAYHRHPFGPTGQITAQVTENVYDSPTGSLLLIPQGTRIIGQYDDGVTFGQRRVLLVWNRLILPGGRSIVLERLPGADASGLRRP
ncbi:MAG: hypothetical protein AcusKO_45120 [Acuticoccus sp.]